MHCMLSFCIIVSLVSLHRDTGRACPSHDRYMCVYKECLSKYRDINKEHSTLKYINILDQNTNTTPTQNVVYIKGYSLIYVVSPVLSLFLFIGITSVIYWCKKQRYSTGRDVSAAEENMSSQVVAYNDTTNDRRHQD